MNAAIVYRRPTVAVVECPPACHTIFVRVDGRANKYYLSFPWTVFVLSYHQYVGDTFCCRPHLGFRNAPLTATDQVLFYPHLYNIYRGNLLVCVDDTFAHLDIVFAKTIENFWGSIFELSPGLHLAYSRGKAYCSDPRVLEYADWQINTRKDPGFITSVGWQPCAELVNVVQSAARFR